MAVVHILFVAALLPLLATIHFIWRRRPKMATLFGRVDAFEENTETWEHYTERLRHYFDADGIEFNNRFRNEGESVADFVAALRNLAEHCEYKDTLEMMLRDRLCAEFGTRKYSDVSW